MPFVQQALDPGIKVCGQGQEVTTYVRHIYIYSTHAMDGRRTNGTLVKMRPDRTSVRLKSE